MFGDRMRALRVQENMTQEELGRVIDCRKSAICKYENGEAELNDVKKIQVCNYFGVSMDYMMGGEEANTHMPADRRERLGKNLRYLRSNSGFTQKFVASRVNVSQQILSMYEKGERVPDLYTAMRLAEQFEVTVEDLVNKRLFDEAGSVASNLKILRFKYGYSKLDMARIGSVTVRVYDGYESGFVDVPATVLRIYAEKFAIPMEQFFKEVLEDGGDCS